MDEVKKAGRTKTYKVSEADRLQTQIETGMGKVCREICIPANVVAMRKVVFEIADKQKLLVLNVRIIYALIAVLFAMQVFNMYLVSQLTNKTNETHLIP